MFEIGLAGIEIDKGDLARFILADDTVGNAVAPARLHEMLKNPYLERHDRTGQGTGHLRPVAPVNGTRRQMEEEVSHGCALSLLMAQKPRQEQAIARTDPLESGDRCEVGVENRRAHGS